MGISMYGGVALSGGKSRYGGPVQSPSRWRLITAPPEVAAQIDASVEGAYTTRLWTNG